MVFDLSYRYYLKDNFNIGWKITAANYAIPPKGYEGKSITLGPVWGYDARLKNKSFGLNFNLFLWATVFTDQKKREWIPGLGYERIHLLSKFNYGTDLDFVFYKPLRISRHISICPGAGCFINVSSFSFDELNDAYQIMRTEDLYYELGIILSMPVFINIGKKDFFVVTLQYNYSFFSNILYPHTFINTFLLKFRLKI